MKITIISSSRNKDQIDDVNFDLTMKGHTVYTLTPYKDPMDCPPTEEEKIMMVLAHIRKVMFSDAVCVITVRT